MRKHTKGVWIARRDPDGAPSDYCIGLNDDCSPIDYIATCHKRDANLISAAPDLFGAACAMDEVATIGVINDMAGFGAAMRLIRAALIKATQP